MLDKIGETEKFPIGYLPKDISYYIATLIDNNNNFTIINPSYDI